MPLEVLVDGERPVSLRALAEPAAEPAAAAGGDPAARLPRAAPAPEIAGSVRVASGPWRMEEGWWLDEPATRAYWDVELQGGGLYRVYRDENGGEWFADGVYD